MKKQWYSSSFKLGMLGGGQLGRMMIQDAIAYNIQIHNLDGDANAPCKAICTTFTHGSITDFDAVYAFGKDKDVITVEIENVNIEALEKLEAEGIKVFPQPRVLRIIRDKGIQKQFYLDNNIPTAPFVLIENQEEIKQHTDFIPGANKMRTGGYDGKGVQILKSVSDISKAFNTPSIIEKLIPFSKELAVIVARNESGEIKTFPTVECEFNPEANLVEFLFSPAEISTEVDYNAQELAKTVISKLEMVGILAVEMFLLEDGSLLVNEIAPRPHNSGHHTIECNLTSQFEQHLRAILNLPLGATDCTAPGVMINLLGAEGYEGNVFYEGLEDAMAKEGVYIHLYGKEITKSFRKMGHITIKDESLNNAKATARELLSSVVVKTMEK